MVLDLGRNLGLVAVEKAPSGHPSLGSAEAVERASLPELPQLRRPWGSRQEPSREGLLLPGRVAPSFLQAQRGKRPQAMVWDFRDW